MAESKDPNWIEHAKLRKGAYGHHTAAEDAKNARKPGKLGRRARLAQTLKSLHSRGAEKLYGKK